jgi:hypothetical protein
MCTSNRSIIEVTQFRSLRTRSVAIRPPSQSAQKVGFDIAAQRRSIRLLSIGILLENSVAQPRPVTR